MPTTAIAVQTTPGPWSTAGTTISFTAADTTNGNHFAVPTTSVGKLVIMANNTGTQSYTASVTSVADPTFGRTGNGLATVASNAFHVFHLTPLAWMDTNSQIGFTGGHASVKFAVINVTGG